MERESVCWQCGGSLKQAAQEPTLAFPLPAPPAPDLTGEHSFDFGAHAKAVADELKAKQDAEAAARRPRGIKRLPMLLNGDPADHAADEVEVAAAQGYVSPAEATRAADPNKTQIIAGTVGDTQIVADTSQQVMYLTYCKKCATQNEEGVTECKRCGAELEVVAVDSVKEIVMPPRAWGFDVLGVGWIALGIAAIVCGQFLVKADPKHPGVTWTDYLWTGAVVCIPGVLIFMRHYFCKLMFWVMTLLSLLTWPLVGLIWYTGHLRISENTALGLYWLGGLSGLSLFSYFVVRTNDAFDMGD